MERAPLERGFEVRGRVQGVGFRWWAVQTARERGLVGWVRNRPDGTVELHAAGTRDELDRFRGDLEAGPPSARVEGVVEIPAEAPAREQDFRVRG